MSSRDHGDGIGGRANSISGTGQRLSRIHHGAQIRCSLSPDSNLSDRGDLGDERAHRRGDRPSPSRPHLSSKVCPTVKHQ